MEDVTVHPVALFLWFILSGLSALCFRAALSSVWFSGWFLHRNRERVGDYANKLICADDECDWVWDVRGLHWWNRLPPKPTCCPACGEETDVEPCRPIRIGRKVVRWERRGE